MKKLLISFALIAVSYTANCQTKEDLKAMITGYKMYDTIKIDDFMKLSEVSLNDKEYSIASFSMCYLDNGFNMCSSSYSNKITEDMKNRLSNFQDKQLRITKLYIEKIKARNSSGKEVNVPPLIFSLRIK